MRIQARAVLCFLSLFIANEVRSDVGVEARHREDSFDYPELTVVPRASDRLKSEASFEASGEGGRNLLTFLPIQVSSALTLASAIASYNSADTSPFYAGLGVGGGWLVLTTLLEMNYRPYAAAYQEVSAMPKGDMRENLSRERFAESQIQRIACAGERLRWLSILSNLGASIYIATKGSGNRNSNSSSSVDSNNSVAQAFNIMSIVGSMAPLVFRFHWSEVASEQSEYKKRIYGPVAGTGFLNEPGTGRLAPGVLLSLHF